MANKETPKRDKKQEAFNKTKDIATSSNKSEAVKQEIKNQTKKKISETIGGDKVEALNKVKEVATADNKAKAALSAGASVAKAGAITAVDSVTGGAGTVADKLWKNKKLIAALSVSAVLLFGVIMISVVATLVGAGDEAGTFINPPVDLNVSPDGEAPEDGIVEVASGSYIDAYRVAGNTHEVPWPLLASVGDILTRHGATSPYDEIERESLTNSLYFNGGNTPLQSEIELQNVVLLGDGTTEQITDESENLVTVNTSVSNTSQTFTIDDVAANSSNASENSQVLISVGINDYLRQPGEDDAISEDAYKEEIANDVIGITTALENVSCVVWVGIPEDGWELEEDFQISQSDINEIIDDNILDSWRFIVPDEISGNIILADESAENVAGQVDQFLNQCQTEEEETQVAEAAAAANEEETREEAPRNETFPIPSPIILPEDLTEQVAELEEGTITINPGDELANNGYGPLLLKPIIVDEIEALKFGLEIPTEITSDITITMNSTTYKGVNLQDINQASDLFAEWLSLQSELVTLEQFFEAYEPSTLADVEITTFVSDNEEEQEEEQEGALITLEETVDTQGNLIDEVYLETLSNFGYNANLQDEIDAFWGIVLTFAPVQWETTVTPPSPPIGETAGFEVLTDTSRTDIAEAIGLSLESAGTVWANEGTVETDLDTRNTQTSLNEQNLIREGYIMILGEDTLTPLLDDSEALAEWQEEADLESLEIETLPVDPGITIYGGHAAGEADLNLQSLVGNGTLSSEFTPSNLSRYGSGEILSEVTSRITGEANPDRVLIIAGLNDYFRDTPLAEYQESVNNIIARNINQECVVWIGTPRDGWDATIEGSDPPVILEGNPNDAGANPGQYNDIVKNSIPNHWIYFDTGDDVTSAEISNQLFKPTIQSSDLENLVTNAANRLEGCVQEEILNSQSLTAYYTAIINNFLTTADGAYTVIGVPIENQLATEVVQSIAQVQGNLVYQPINDNPAADAANLANALISGNPNTTPEFVVPDGCRTRLEPVIDNINNGSNTDFTLTRQPGETEAAYIENITTIYQESLLGTSITSQECSGSDQDPRFLNWILERIDNNETVPALTNLLTIQNENANDNSVQSVNLNSNNLTIESWVQQNLKLASEYVNFTGAGLTGGGSGTVGGLVAAGVPIQIAEAYVRGVAEARIINPECDIPVEHLAAHGWVESRHAKLNGGIHKIDLNGDISPPIKGPELSPGSGFRTVIDTDNGAYDGNPTWDHAVGFIQFIPETWDRFAVDSTGDGFADPQNIWDMAVTSANFLCKNLPTGGSFFEETATREAVWRYNQSDEYYEDIIAERARIESVTASFASPSAFQALNIDLGAPITVTNVVKPWGANIPIHTQFAPHLSALLDAAYADGHEFHGWGYRSTERQIQLRIKNGCADIYTASSSTCSPPTARPGSSRHERGLAVDFYCLSSSGAQIRFADCRSPITGERAFDWMVANAGNFGFINLPSEPWHWSDTGG